MKRKLFGSLMCTVVLCLFMCMAALAEWGTCGSDLESNYIEWHYDENAHELIIIGIGEMKNYVDSGNRVSPWKSYGFNQDITRVQIYEGVTSIGEYAFYGCEKLTNIKIPSTVQSIGICAFYGCKELKEITIPSSVQSIGKHAFDDCFSLKEINIPLGVETLPTNVFNNCSSLTTIHLPASLTTIEGFAFQDCSSLTRVDIPSSLGSIGQYIFQLCNNLTDVYYDGTSTQWDAIAKDKNWRKNAPDFTMHFHYIVNFDANGHGTAPDAQSGLWTPALVTDPGNPTASGYNFTGWYKDKDCTQKWDFSNDTVEGDMTLYAGWKEEPKPDLTPDQKQDPAPETPTSPSLSGTYKTKIGTVLVHNGTAEITAPTNKKAKSINIPNTVVVEGQVLPITSIAPNAFKGMKNLKSATIGANIESIGKNAFKGCKNLKKMTFKTVKLKKNTVGANAFKGIHAKAVVKIPKSVKKQYQKFLLKKGMKKSMKFK